MTKIVSFFLGILYAISTAFSFVPRTVWFGNETYSPAEPESCLFDVVLIADVHSDSDYFNDRSKTIRKLLCGISQADSIPDALVIAGDLSNATDKKEYGMLRWSLETFNKIPSVIPAVGNHDTRASDTYEEARTLFCDFAADCDIETDTVYYSTSVNGYPFIVLGSEAQHRLDAEISPVQLMWFEEQLQNALKTEKPVFIVSHQPLYNSNNVFFNDETDENYGIGEQSAEIEEILRKYVPGYDQPVFFISGHLHRDYNDYSVDTSFCNNLYCVNIPSAVKTGDGGLGMALEVYPGKIILRARNYITAEWLDKYAYTFDY